MRVLIYTRVSTKEQVDEGNSLATQEKICRNYAYNNDLRVAGVYVEEGASAKSVDREKLRQMMEYCSLNKGKIDAILIYRIDRLSREASDYAQLKSFFNVLGIKVISATENIEDSPTGRFVENMFASIAQLDNDVRAERSKNGMIDAVKQGRWVWKAPFGYKNTIINGQKNIAPNTDNNTAELISEGWRYIEKGYPIHLALEVITINGLKNEKGDEISLQLFSKMLRNKIYKGTIEAFDLEIQSETIVPIVDSDVWDNVYSKITSNKLSNLKHNKYNPAYPLRGLLYCPDGHKLTGSAPRGNGGVYPKYHCPKCRGLSRSYDVEEINSRFESFADSLNYEINFREALKEAVKANLVEINRFNNKKRAELKQNLSKLERTDKEIARKNVEGIITDEVTRAVLAENSSKKTDIKLELNQLDYEVDDAEDIIQFGLETLSSIGKVWRTIDDMNIKMRFQKWLFPAGLVYDGVDFGTSQLPMCLSVKKDLSEEKSLLVTSPGIEPGLPG